MTTLAWDGITLAADRQINDGSRPITGTKVHRIEVKGEIYLVGFCGGYGAALKFLEHFKKKGWTKYPDIKDATIVILSKDEGNEIGEDGTLTPMNECPWGWGSGGDYALGAIKAGATAEEAVAIAIELDINSGIGIDTVIF